jgi:hypothetical protein
MDNYILKFIYQAPKNILITNNEMEARNNMSVDWRFVILQ